jgi:hypothetical protein
MKKKPNTWIMKLKKKGKFSSIVDTHYKLAKQGKKKR